MNLFKRLLLISPFLIASYFLISSQLADYGCNGFIDATFFLAKLIICFIFFIYAVIISLRKRQSEKLKIEPISGVIILITFVIVFISIANKDVFIGKIILEAEGTNFGMEEGLEVLTFRNNNRVTYLERNIDFGCYKTFNYSITDDTISLENDIGLSGNLKISKKYLKNNTRLQPINSSNKIDTTSNYISFTIVSKK